MRPTVRHFVLAGTVAALAALAGACAQPFEGDLATQVSDSAAPGITISTPADGSSYAAVVLVEGTVSDTLNPEGGAGQAVSVAYDVLSTSISGSTTVGSDGSFSMSFATTGLSGSITLRITAVDWNGNVQETFRTLVNEGSIPTFAAQPANQSVTLSWEDVPLAESYAIRYAGTGRVPSTSSGTLVDDVTSPVTVTDLQNGSEYSFLLEARHAGGLSSYSEIVSSIPLSQFTLIPSVVPSYEEVSVSWNPVEGAERYELLRSTSSNGPFAQITGAQTATNFVDRSVAADTRYYYAVRPAGEDSIVSGPAGGEVSPFPEEPLEIVTSALGLFNTGRSVTIVGDRAYVAEFGSFFSDWAQLSVFDITSPYNPVRLGFERLTAGPVSQVRDVEVVGTTAYLTSDAGKLHTVDVGDPTAMVDTETVVFGYTDTQAIAIAGGFAYVADGSGGLLKVDASTLDPTAAPTLGASDAFMDVVVSNGYAYVAGGTGGLVIVDLSSFPSSNTVAFPGDSVSSVTVEGDYAYVTLGPGSATPGVGIVDISTPGSGTVVGTASTANGGVDVSVTNGRAYVSAGSSGLAIVDVNDPTDPAVVVEQATSDETLDTELDDGFLYTVGGSPTTFVSYLVNPYPQPIAGSAIASAASSVRAVANGVIVATTNSKIDFFNQSSGTLIASIPAATDFQIGWTEVHGNHVLYTSTNTVDFDSAQLASVRIDSPNSVTPVGTLDIGSLVYSMAVAGDHVYLGGFGALLTVDISDPAAMAVAGFAPVPDLAQWITINGSIAYLVTADLINPNFAIATVDISIPASPRVLDTTALAASPTWVGISGTIAHVALDSGSLEMVDVSDPTSIASLGTQALSVGSLRYATYQGNYLYAVGSGGVDIVDLSDSASLVTISTWPITPDGALVISGRRAIFSDGGTIYRALLTP